VGFKLVTQKNLLVAVLLLAAVKFLLIPLFAWQLEMVSELDSKSRRLEKLDLMISKEVLFNEELKALNLQLESKVDQFYVDNHLTQLSIQREVQELFVLNGMESTGFSWVIDSGDSQDFIRVLRGTVFFSGSTKAMIKTFWDLSASHKLIKTVAWYQQIKGQEENALGVTSGNVTLEFYALTGNLGKKYTEVSSD
tara:strand:+ start:4084 stop:4668 length:585 start_codon:yes stop_codon:yes gene_type:complete